jgi:hypothetical protein
MVTVLAAATLAIGMASIGVAAAPAGAGVQARAAGAAGAAPDFVNKTSVQLCAASLHNQCMSSTGGAGGLVRDQSLNAGGAQNVDILQQTVCGMGSAVTVNPDCPFTPGSNFNADLKNRTIAIIELVSTGHNFHGTADQRLREGTGDGQLWVIDGDLTSNDGAFLINVNWSNEDTALEYACTDGVPGDPIVLSQTGNGLDCRWIAH